MVFLMHLKDLETVFRSHASKGTFDVFVSIDKLALYPIYVYLVVLNQTHWLADTLNGLEETKVVLLLLGHVNQLLHHHWHQFLASVLLERAHQFDLICLHETVPYT